MFSGIIETMGRVKTVSGQDKSLIVVVASGFAGLELGESIAVNGVCLTITKFTKSGLATFFVSPETIKRSNFGSLSAGDLVNLERAVRLETRLSGHLVQGHVDAKATLFSLNSSGGAYRLQFLVPLELARYCIEKGSIALNGISLTINLVAPGPEGNALIEITIIPHTWKHTNLHTLNIGDQVNVEIDAIAKYVESLCQPYLKP